MTDTKGKVVAVNGNMVSVEFDGKVSLNEVGYVKVGGKSLKGEVIRIRGNTAQMQIYEMTNGISTDCSVEFTGDLLSAPLSPYRCGTQPMTDVCGRLSPTSDGGPTGCLRRCGAASCVSPYLS